MLTRKQVEQVANIEHAWYYPRSYLEDIILESWPEAAIVNAFAELMDKAQHK